MNKQQTTTNQQQRTNNKQPTTNTSATLSAGNQQLITNLKSVLGMLELEPEDQLKKDVLALGDYLENPNFRIAVFAPFNYGKSTLLNALLGQRTLPIDLIPTTGAAISVCYGATLSSSITLTDGSIIQEEGTNLLKRYAILDDQRCMGSDVASVTVYSPHPFLKTGVEFLDLPGTNDREAQDKLVRDRLLTADLIIQVLDARKLMTLGERDNLKHWLLDRDINTVIFVVNFLNLLEPEEQKEVQQRLRFIATSFRATLPSGISNLYRVDALPALRARLKGNSAAAQTTGLTEFASALQTIVSDAFYSSEGKEKLAVRLPRLKAIALQVQTAGENKAKEIAAEIAAQEDKLKEKIEINQKAEKLIQEGFDQSINQLQAWLDLPQLLINYGQELTLALEEDKFPQWHKEKLQPKVLEYEQEISKWVSRGCEFFQQEHPGGLSIPFPPVPEIPSSTSSSSDSSSSASERNNTKQSSSVKVDPVLMAAKVASYILHKATAKPKDFQSSTTNNKPNYRDLATDYLTRFSKSASMAVRQYQEIAMPAITFSATPEISNSSQSHYQLKLLNTLLENLLLVVSCLLFVVGCGCGQK